MRVMKDRLASEGVPWRRLGSAAVLVLSVAFLGWKAYGSWDALRVYDWHIRYLRLIPSFVLFLFQTAIVVWGWQSIMDSLTEPLPFRKHIRIYAYTNLMRRIPAGILWVIAGRAYAYKDENISARTSTVGSLLEMWLVVLSGLPLAALAASGLSLLSPVTGVALAVVALILELGAMHPVVLHKLLGLAGHIVPKLELTYRRTLYWASIYTLIWLVSGIGLFAMVRVFTDAPIESVPMTVGAWVLSSLIAYVTLLSPSGLGVKELSLTVLLGVFLSDPLPLLIALAMRVVWTAYDIVVGVVAWLL